jgi:hypothetical protein
MKYIYLVILLLFVGCDTSSLKENFTTYDIVENTNLDKDKYQVQDITKVDGKLVVIVDDQSTNKIALDTNKSNQTYGHQGANCEDGIFYNPIGMTVYESSCNDISTVIGSKTYMNGFETLGNIDRWITGKVSNGKAIFHSIVDGNQTLISYDVNNTVEFTTKFNTFELNDRVTQGLFYYDNKYYVSGSNNSKEDIIVVYDTNGTVLDIHKLYYEFSFKNEVEGVYVDDTGIYMGIIVAELLGRKQYIGRIIR